MKLTTETLTPKQAEKMRIANARHDGFLAACEAIRRVFSLQLVDISVKPTRAHNRSQHRKCIQTARRESRSLSQRRGADECLTNGFGRGIVSRCRTWRIVVRRNDARAM
jgi:hypothetical protein